MGSPNLNVHLMQPADARALLPDRKPDGQKGTFGRVVVVGGSANYIGAPILAAIAAYRSGAGLVSLCVPDVMKPIAAHHLPEATFLSLPELLARRDVDALVLGPGMGLDDAARDTHAQVLAWAALGGLNGMLIDADALTLSSPMVATPPAVPTVLTPHPGEMARLCACSTAEVQGDRIGNAMARAQQWQRVVLLKGAHTVIAAPDGHTRVLPHANPALAVAGSGDVLAGCIGGLLAQGVSAAAAAALGAWLHAEAGELWRARNGDAGLLASELCALLPLARRAIQLPK